MSIAYLLQGLVVAGIVALVGFAFRQEKRTTRMETVLTGYNGENGINGTMKKLRAEHDDAARADSAALGDAVMIAYNQDLQGCEMFCYVSASNVVTVVLRPCTVWPWARSSTKASRLSSCGEWSA